MMSSHAVAPAVSACVVLFVSFASFGCTSDVPGAVGAKNVYWGRLDAGKEPVPGIDKASVDFGIWGDGAAIVVWSDSGSTGFGGGGMGGRELEPGETRKGARYEGRITTQDGRRVDLECYTPDGTTGTVRIGSGTYQLADGALFLVSTKGPEVRVRQLELASLTPESDSPLVTAEMSAEKLQAVAEADPDIRAFFNGRNADSGAGTRK